MKFSAPHLAAILGLLAALVVFYLKANPIVLTEHGQFENDLDHFQQLDMTLNQDILKARFHLLSNYDAFPDLIGKLTEALGGLRDLPGFIPHPARRLLTARVGELKQLFARKEELLETFKSQNSALNNSLTYLPTAVSNLIEHLSTDGVSRELETSLNEVMRQVLVYNLDSTSEHADDIHRSLEKLNDWRSSHADLPQATTLASLDAQVAHVNSIVNRKEKVEAITREIVSLPIGAKVDALRDSYREEFANALRNAELFDAAWRILCGLLVVGIGYTIYALKAANADLDRRVHERTKDLAYERGLLHSLLEHSPDHIYFKDRQSRFLKTSMALANRFGANHAQEIEGKTDFDFLREEQARARFEGEQEIIRTGQPLIGHIEKQTHVDGPETWVLSSKMPLRNEAQEIVGTFGISKDITEMKKAEAELARLNQQLRETSRQAGMAEVATSVLHNVGNVLNSVNVSATLVVEKTRQSKLGMLSKTTALLDEHAADLGHFITEDAKGKQLPAYLTLLAGHLRREQQEIVAELESLRKNIDHIKDIVGMQQNYARISGVSEVMQVVDLVEDSLQMNSAALVRHQVQLMRDYQEVPAIPVEKHKVLQILVNLIRNAKYACDEGGAGPKQVTVRVAPAAGRIQISVIDTGVGIPPENLTRIFNHGFTTRASGHGFGLHSSALAAREMGGALTAHSAGPGTGATFTLDLPVQPLK